MPRRPKSSLQGELFDLPGAVVRSEPRIDPEPDSAPRTPPVLRLVASRPEPSFLSLRKNLALMAGAGAGKTYNLVTLCLHLLGGARDGLPRLRPAQLCLLTFTEKAAAEMRQRLWTRLDALATDRVDASGEPELRESFARLEAAFPPPSFWRGVRDELGGATLSTFHALCLQLLRAAPAGFDVDPGFVILEEQEASELLTDAAERTVLDALEREDAEVVELCRHMDFTSGMPAWGLVGALGRVLTQLRDEGLAPESLDPGDEEEARKAFEVALAKVRELAAVTLAAASGRHILERPNVEGALKILGRIGLDSYPGACAELAGIGKQMGRGGSFRDLRNELLGKQTLRDAYGGVVAARLQRVVCRLLVDLSARHRAALAQRGALDFAELLLRTRDLLRDHPLVRHELQSRMGALLVDEFQDTNRLQLELVTLLAERRGGPAGTLEPAFLCAVGDRKQSIYEFRGADVSVFQHLAEQLSNAGGEVQHLTRNFRSSPRLLSFFNAFFARALAPQLSGKDYEVSYRPADDDLTPARSDEVPGPAVQRLTFEVTGTADAGRRVDAEAVARCVARMLSPDSETQVRDGGALRRVRGGDIAILFRRFTFVETYRQALIRFGIPHRVIRGRGFYGAQEVLDLASLLALVAQPADPVALAAVLRSPLVALSDGSLFKLAQQTGRLSLASAREAAFQEHLKDAERRRLAALLGTVDALRKERDRLDLRVILQVVMDAVGYRVALAGTAYGEQALANVDKLLELAARRDASGRADCASFARELFALADADPIESQADVVDASDPRAVQLLTVHQAKGLEWPVVVVPDLGARPLNSNAVILFDRAHGVGVRPILLEVGEALKPPRHERIRLERADRDRAEHQRLLYVALTRARDRLVLSGTQKVVTGTWRELVDKAIDADEKVRSLVEDVPLDSLLAPRRVEAAAGPDAVAANAKLEAAVARVRQRAAPQARTTVLPVTHLQNFAVCPRRYLYANQVGLTEHPVVFELEDAEGPSLGRTATDPRQRGTLAHRLLERVDLRRLADDALLPHLKALLWAEGMDPDEPGARDILRRVVAFLKTPFAAALARAGAARIHRELPFVLQVSSGLHLKGKIDLLFEDDEGGAVVVDYKFSAPHPGGLGPYTFQLDCYALAARRLVQDGVRVRTGLAFLGSDQPAPRLQDAKPAAALAAFEASLVASAERLAGLQRGGEWPGRPEAECVALGCGYRYRCHAPPA